MNDLNTVDLRIRDVRQRLSAVKLVWLPFNFLSQVPATVAFGLATSPPNATLL